MYIVVIVCVGYAVVDVIMVVSVVGVVDSVVIGGDDIGCVDISAAYIRGITHTGVVFLSWLALLLLLLVLLLCVLSVLLLLLLLLCYVFLCCCCPCC